LELFVDVGGKPGADCGGFCSFCYFKKVKNFKPLGCRVCSPLSEGCYYGCFYTGRAIAQMRRGFKPLLHVAQRVHEKLKMYSKDPEKVAIAAEADLTVTHID
jgi:[methyl coenzyme M reductase]-L-arginine C-5-methyltransferase